MKFGLVVPNDFPPGTVPADRFAAMIADAQRAEAAGFDSIWLLQHYLSNMPTLQPLPTLAALSQHTSTIRLGTNIFILPLHPTVAVAEAFATLDHLSSGRVIAGLGLGYRENEFAAFGLELDDRVSRFEEATPLLRRLWAGETVTFEGVHHRLHEVALSTPALQTQLPLWVGAGAHATGARRAAATGDAWIVPPHTPLVRIEELYEAHRAEQRRLGMPAEPRYVVRREVLLADDAERAFELGVAARGDLSEAYSRFNAPNATSDYRHLSEGDLRAGVERVATEAYIFTDPATAVEEFAKLAAIGVTDVIVRMSWFDLPPDATRRSLELFRDEVMPALST